MFLRLWNSKGWRWMSEIVVADWCSPRIRDGHDLPIELCGHTTGSIFRTWLVLGLKRESVGRTGISLLYKNHIQLTRRNSIAYIFGLTYIASILFTACRDDHAWSSASNQCAYSHPLDYIVEPDWRQTGESWFLLYFSLLVTKCVIGLLTLWHPSPGRNRFPILSNLCLNSQNIDNWRWPI